ncbi:hypothetical protein HMPREF9123_1882, partial [Neisseria bacilliformis ATCC BAA-1200]
MTFLKTQLRHSQNCETAFFRRPETFAKFLFPQQPKPKHRFSAVSAPNHS